MVEFGTYKDSMIFRKKGSWNFWYVLLKYEKNEIRVGSLNEAKKLIDMWHTASAFMNAPLAQGTEQ